MGPSFDPDDTGKVVRSKKSPDSFWDVDGRLRVHPTRSDACQVRLRSRETKKVSWVGSEHFWENFEEVVADYYTGAIIPDVHGLPVSSIDDIRLRIDSLLSDAVGKRSRPILTDAERVDLSSAELSIRNGLDRLLAVVS